MSRRTAWLAWSVCGLTVVLIACAVALAFLNRSADVRAVIFPLCLTLSAVVGGLVASRRPANPVGCFFLGSGGCFAITLVATEYATYGLPGAQAMAWLQSWLWVPGVMLLLCFLPLYFPNGRLVSRRWRWVVRLALFSCVTGAALSALSPGEIPATEDIDNPLGIEALKPVSDLLEPVYLALYFFLWFASAASQVVRFRRSGSLERQQIKWLAFAASAVPVWFLTNAPIEAASRTLFDVMEALIFVALIPLAAGVAILRYRLYDIDVVINRTIVYGSLTAILVVVYFGGVATTQATFRALTDQQQPQLAIVVSTLVIAALFNPLRQRIQGLIDRRFYRRKYDARKTLENFSARLRDETDLAALNDGLVAVARDTMQPEHVSLWLRSPTEAGRGGESSG